VFPGSGVVDEDLSDQGPRQLVPGLLIEFTRQLPQFQFRGHGRHGGT
jgi:hypothetical protein